MFKTKFISLALIGLFVWATGFTLAQDEPKDQLYWVREEVVKVEKWKQYEETSKEWVELMTGAGLDFPYMRASQRDDGHYYYLLPLSSYADIDKFGEKFGSAIEKIGREKWSEFMKRNESSMDYHKDFIVKWSAKYSYVPKEPRVNPAEAGFLHWIFFNYKLENRKEVLDILAEWKALYEEHNIPDGWSTWMIEVGEQNDLMAITEFAKDGASFYAAMDENSEKIKEEEQKLWQKLSQYVTGMEQKFGQPRPDLGFMNMDMEE
jgi:hypothetical protein